MQSWAVWCASLVVLFGLGCGGETSSVDAAPAEASVSRWLADGGTSDSGANVPVGDAAETTTATDAKIAADGPHSVEVAAGPGGQVTIEKNSQLATLGHAVAIEVRDGENAPSMTAKPNPGCVFSNWTENGVIVSDSPTFVLVQVGNNRRLRANFVLEASSPIVLTEFQPGHGFTFGSGASARNPNDTSDYARGVQSCSWETGGAGAMASCQSNKIGPVSAEGKFFRITLKISDVSHLKELDFFAGDSQFANYWKWRLQVPIAGGANSVWIRSGEWASITFGFQDGTPTGSPDRRAIESVKLAAYDDGQASISVRWNAIELVPEGLAMFPQGVISICFDDGWLDMLPGVAEMDRLGLVGTNFVIADRSGTAAYLSKDEIVAMREGGWEISGHAATDADHAESFSELSASAVEADFKALREYLDANGFGSGLSFPKGSFTPEIIATAKRYFSYARTTFSRTHETYPPADRFRLRAVSPISSYPGGVSPASLYTDSTGMIDATGANGGWLILVFHKVVSSASAVTEISESDFAAIMSKIVRSGMPVLPVRDVLATLGG
jgi:hypothetical protein